MDDDDTDTHMDRDSFDDDWNKWFYDAEQDLCDVMGLDGDERRKRCGRAAGPKFVWGCAIEDIASLAAGANAVSREWRCVAQWAKQLAAVSTCQLEHGSARNGVVSAANAARRRLANLVGRMREQQAQGRSGIDLGPRLAACAAIHRADDHLALESIAERAKKEATTIERQDAARKIDQWKQWLRSGHADGLRNQHRFTRTPTGWIPSRIAAKPAARLSGADDVSRLTEGEMRRIITGDATNTAPLSPQCTVEKEAEEWGKLWAAQERLPPLSWPTELGPMPPRPSVQKLRAALATFPPDTGLSWDALHPRALRRLSDARLERLIDFLMMAERRGQWPATMGTGHRGTTAEV